MILERENNLQSSNDCIKTAILRSRILDLIFAQVHRFTSIYTGKRMSPVQGQHLAAIHSRLENGYLSSGRRECYL